MVQQQHPDRCATRRVAGVLFYTGGVTDERAIRIARQHALTSRLLGVDFLPVGAGAVVRAPVDSSPGSVAEGRPAQATAGASTTKGAALAALREEHDRECPHCTKATAHTQTVWGDGDPDARLMFIGEAPGADEDREGVPFVGRSGQLLNQMIAAMGLSRDRVYIANVLKSRPPNNDTPTGEEAAKCGVYLRQQVRIISPWAIVTMGNPATQYMLETKQGITGLRGRWQEYEGIPLMPTFHPAYLLRNYTADNRKLVWSDLRSVMERL